MMIDFEINDKGTLVWNDGSSRPATHQEQELTYEIAYRDDQIKALQAEVERLRPQSNRENLPYEADWRIQSLIHVPTLAVADRPSDAFVEFIESDLLENHHELVKAWPAIAGIEDAPLDEYAAIFAEQCPFEFLAVVDFAINNNFRFNDQGEFQSCNCSWGYYRQVWLFANSMNELINKAIILSSDYFDKAEREAKEQAND